MGTELEEHKKKKAYKVNGWDIISTGLGIAGTLVIVVSAMQPKNPINMLRLPAALTLFAVSVGAERLRESDLLSLDRALQYEKNLQSDRLRFSTVIGEELHRVSIAEEAYSQLPPDRHLEIAQKIGIAPPNYAARQPDPVVQQLQQPVTQTPVTQTIEPDPTGDFDPEQQAEKRSNSGSSFIPAEKVSDWFAQMGKAIPDALIEEWKTEPGTGISIEDGNANIIRRES